jgi:hypothetical protein
MLLNLKENKLEKERYAVGIIPNAVRWNSYRILGYLLDNYEDIGITASSESNFFIYKGIQDFCEVLIVNKKQKEMFNDRFNKEKIKIEI